MSTSRPWEYEGATFRDREKSRYRRLKHKLFTLRARIPGIYRGKRRSFCIANRLSYENLHPAARVDALDYFRERGITWHDGQLDWEGRKGAHPSNHLCCSQCACVNSLWPMSRDPELLARVFGPFLPELDEPLPMTEDGALPGGGTPFVAFEWIGTENYLGERGNRKRGANATSADFSFRFRRTDGRTRLVLGEWKYTEHYRRSPLSRAKINQTRWDVYHDAFQRWADEDPDLPPYEGFFVDPHYQFMRQMLLAREIEAAGGDGEMSADVVSVLHVSPDANREFHDNLGSALALQPLGSTVTKAWSRIAPADRFLAISSESLYEAIADAADGALEDWRDYLLLRYGWWMGARR
jgi:hypothetical protein